MERPGVSAMDPEYPPMLGKELVRYIGPEYLTACIAAHT